MELRTGTSGYSYKEWKGPFYPEKISPKEMLAYYAERLGSVEINNTFYRMPKREVLESWAEQVPEGFRFAVKASRRITHLKRLKEVGEETAFLLGNLDVLGRKLGCVLFQLPPNLKADTERLDRFLELIPTGFPAAFEFRNETWFCDDVFERLRERNFALVLVDDEEKEPDLVRTADWGYLRLRRAEYTPRKLSTWLGRVRKQDWRDAFVFFKHEDAGAGPKLAQRFGELHEARKPRRSAPAKSRTKKRAS